MNTKRNVYTLRKVADLREFTEINDNFILDKYLDNFLIYIYIIHLD